MQFLVIMTRIKTELNIQRTHLTVQYRLYMDLDEIVAWFPWIEGYFFAVVNAEKRTWHIGCLWKGEQWGVNIKLGLRSPALFCISLVKGFCEDKILKWNQNRFNVTSGCDRWKFTSGSHVVYLLDAFTLSSLNSHSKNKRRKFTCHFEFAYIYHLRETLKRFFNRFRDLLFQI